MSSPVPGVDRLESVYAPEDRRDHRSAQGQTGAGARQHDHRAAQDVLQKGHGGVSCGACLHSVFLLTFYSCWTFFCGVSPYNFVSYYSTGMFCSHRIFISLTLTQIPGDGSV